LFSSDQTKKCCDYTTFPYFYKFSTEYNSKAQNELEIALNNAAAYQSWRALDPGRNHSIDERYAAMPALTKRDIRKHFPQGFVPFNQDIHKGLAGGEIEFVKTSGSTGDNVTNIWNQEWWDASERASWTLNSYATKVATGTHPEAILANPLNVGVVSDDVDLPIEKRRLSRFLYLNEKSNPLLWTPHLMNRMIRELEIFQPIVLEANPSLLGKLSRYISTLKMTVFQPQLIVFTYEYPTNFNLHQIRRIFNTPLASSYGTTEVGYVFMQCEKGKFHQNIEFCRVDFQPLKPEHGGPTLGRILVTTFNNPWYIMVRFNVGDLVLLDKDKSCSCGRDAGFILSAIEGRTTNITLTCKGRLVTLRELDNAIGVLEGIDEYQLIQTANEYRLHLVSQRIDKNVLQYEASGILNELYGKEAQLSITFKKAIAPSISGKYNISQALFPVNIEDYLDDRYLCQRID
jgi:phenylacetate-coenzyme A ligase PaaK-like adenylate-forming protein